jgi:dienelactone hydrolase
MGRTLWPMTRPWLRRGLRLLALALLLGAGGVLALVYDAHRDRAAWFAARVGRVDLVERRPVEAPPGVSGEAVRLRSSTGLAVELRLLRAPHVPGAALRPAAVILGGHRTGRDAVELVGDPGEVVVAALDYPLEGDDRIKGLRAILESLPRIRRALLDTPAAAALALDWLATEPGVDPARIELLGVSLGGVFAPVAGGISPRAARVWLVHGAGEPRAWLDHGLRRKVGFAPLRWAAGSLAFLLARGPAFAPERWLPDLGSRELVVVAGRNDDRLPAAMVEEYLERVEGPLRLRWTDGGHVDPDEPEILRELVGTVLDGIAGEPPPRVR